MRKCLAVFMFMLVLTVVPLQADNQANQTQLATRSSKPSPPVPVIAPQQASSQSVQPAQEKHVDADVRIIQVPAKDRYDKAGFWVNIGLAIVGFLGIGIGVCTLWLIRTQVIEMRRQLHMTVDKERARIEIKGLGLELQRVSEEFWHIKATIELRNVGTGRAYVRLGTGNLVVAEDNPPTESHWNSLDVVDGFVDPSGDPVTQSFYFFQPENAALSEYAQNICDGVVGVYITGFIEYETVGTRFHRNFNYAWVGHGSPINIGARLTFSDEFVPKTDEDRVSFGFWSPNSIWLTGRSGDNDEYEMETPKGKKKPRENTN
jgi:hypothetical protein